MKIKNYCKQGCLPLILLFSLNNSWALDQSLVGSEAFGEFTTGTLPWSELVSFSRDPKFGSNIYYSDFNYVNGLAGAYVVGGAGEKNYQANALNFQATMVRSAARAEPRTPNFIKNSLAKNVTTFSNQDDELNKLAGQQVGDPDLIYLESEMIRPSIGTYQTADNQFSFQAANDNIGLTEAEMALFEGDRASAIAYFDKKKAQYKNSKGKQFKAADFQKDGVLRTKETAETFRDFFRYKESVTNMNLSRMPTEEGLIANCQVQTSPTDDDTAVYRLGMNKADAKLYEMAPPKYNFNFCETYVHREGSYLLRNLHVHDTLAAISKSSGEMASSLDEVAKYLSNKNRSTADIYKYLGDNETLRILNGRWQGHKKCAETNCLETRKLAFKKVVEYKGFEKEIDPLRRDSVQLTQAIIQMKKLPDELLSSTIANPSKKGEKPGFYKKMGKFLEKITNGKTNQKFGNPGQAKENKSKNKGTSQISSSGITYDPSGLRKDGNYFRDKNGVLRGVKSGNAVQLLAAPEHLILFDIISSRYKKKFYGVKSSERNMKKNKKTK